MSLRRIGAVLALALALAACASSASAATARTNLTDVEDEVMCDTCNVPLYIAESPRADQLRREIRVLIAQGETKNEIKATLKDRYGPAILAMPQRSGFSLAAYLVPILAALGLLALMAVLLPRWRRRGRERDEEPPEPDLSDADRGRLEDELAQFDGR
ncbi:unannotated protein [freshwater metagenome]|uniref:Unannotated protein n=1 Tax=freshwater metagenome TaxID=449393 RepID=A0A6J7CQV2_9ZZZZ|nr:hypothetical protein [Actinomycetota bacterium]